MNISATSPSSQNGGKPTLTNPTTDSCLRYASTSYSPSRVHVWIRRCRHLWGHLSLTSYHHHVANIWHLEAMPFVCPNNGVCALDRTMSLALCCPPPSLSQPCQRYTECYESSAIDSFCSSDCLTGAENLFWYCHLPTDMAMLRAFVAPNPVLPIALRTTGKMEVAFSQVDTAVTQPVILT